MEIEAVFRSSIETQKQLGWKIAKNIWFTFRDGKIPPTVSPWGAVLINIEVKPNGNFYIPSGSWWELVINHLQVSSEWLKYFCMGFDGVTPSSLWYSLASLEEIAAFDMGKKLAQEYIN